MCILKYKACLYLYPEFIAARTMVNCLKTFSNLHSYCNTQNTALQLCEI